MRSLWRVILAAPIIVLAGPALAGEARPAELGVFVGPACTPQGQVGVANAARFADWLGRRPDRVLDFAWQPSWREMLHSTQLLSSCWREAGYKKLTFSRPLIPKDGEATLSDGADGKYDSHFRDIGAALVANGFGDAIIRLGWEFNIPGYAWSAYRDPKSFVLMWRRAVLAMRSVPGAHFTFDWCPTLDMALKQPGRIAPDTVYPGDVYVDYVGMDFYNSWWGAPTADFSSRWSTWMNYKYGLIWQRDFAAAHGKPMSFPEWGTGTRPDGHGGGDDAEFVKNVAAWIRQNNVKYQDYWDRHASDYDGAISDGTQPNAGAAYRAAFGRQ